MTRKDRSRHDPDLCALFAGAGYVALAAELKALEPDSKLVGLATHARPGADGFDASFEADHRGCILCTLSTFRKRRPRRKIAWALYVELAGARRMYSRKTTLPVYNADHSTT